MYGNWSAGPTFLFAEPAGKSVINDRLEPFTEYNK
jgi:hypothetical protein